MHLACEQLLLSALALRDIAQYSFKRDNEILFIAHNLRIRLQAHLGPVFSYKQNLFCPQSRACGKHLVVIIH